MTAPLLVWRRSRRLYTIARAHDRFMGYYIETKKLRECSLGCVEADVPNYMHRFPSTHKFYFLI